jgi:hypothetical protein
MGGIGHHGLPGSAAATPNALVLAVLVASALGAK